MTGHASYDVAAAHGVPPVGADPDRACNGADTELFYPRPGEHPAEALAMCGRCPVRRRCLAWALETEQSFGVWGGKTARQRQDILRARPVRRGTMTVPDHTRSRP